MTENEEPKKTFLQEFKGITPKQWAAIVVAFAICIALVYTGMFLRICLGFFLVAIILYMIPHVFGVSSPKVKSVYGAVFIVAIVLIAAFAYSGAADNAEADDGDGKYLKEKHFDFDTYDISVDVVDSTAVPVIKYEEITSIVFGLPQYPDMEKADTDPMSIVSGNTYSYDLASKLKAGKYYVIEVSLEVEGDDDEYYKIRVNTGIDGGDVNAMSLKSSISSIAVIGLMFFLMLLFSELMRKSARKKRDQLIAEGRLYPEGYDKCKECGAMVLPGEIVCRKCGAPIEVPDEIKVLHKKDFFECSECGTEVPMDAKFCPKCGAVFDEDTETEISHADGTVDVSKETFECSECGKEVPANATRCPYCGAEFDEDEDEE